LRNLNTNSARNASVYEQELNVDDRDFANKGDSRKEFCFPTIRKSKTCLMGLRGHLTTKVNIDEKSAIAS